MPMMRRLAAFATFVALVVAFVAYIGYIQVKKEDARWGYDRRPDFEEIWKKRSMPINWHSTYGRMPS